MEVYGTKIPPKKRVGERKAAKIHGIQPRYFLHSDISSYRFAGDSNDRA